MIVALDEKRNAIMKNEQRLLYISVVFELPEGGIEQCDDFLVDVAKRKISREHRNYCKKYILLDNR